MEKGNKKSTASVEPKANKSFRGKIGRRITGIVIVCFCSAIVIVATMSIRESRALAADLLIKNCVSATNFLASQIEGSSLDDDHTQLLDSLKDATGCELTIFSNDVRASTTIIKDGKRVVGTPLDSAIADIVLKQKQPYTGAADILGLPHLCSYAPIIKDGKAIGLVFAGISQSEVNATINTVRANVIAISLVLLGISCCIILLFVKFGISNPLGKLAKLAKDMENGNLGIGSDKVISTNIHSNDEIGLLANTFESTFKRLQEYIKEISDYLGMLAAKDLRATTKLNYVGDFQSIQSSLENISSSLNDTMDQIHIASSDVSCGSSQVSQAAQLLSSGATQQASAIDELSSALASIAEHVNQNSITAREAQEKAELIDKFVQETNIQMQQMVDAMAQISESSNKIADIEKTIEDITFQTNILALNASVEASRAGKAGKGFAVVANEVRNLASKSSDASKDTANHIEQTLKAVNNGTNIVNATKESTIEATNRIDEIVGLVTNISNATTEQATSIQQFTAAIKEISAVVQTNSSTAEESAAASQQLSSHAESLLDMVDSFTRRTSRS